jgi:hypothetical protein
MSYRKSDVVRLQNLLYDILYLIDRVLLNAGDGEDDKHTVLLGATWGQRLCTQDQ